MAGCGLVGPTRRVFRVGEPVVGPRNPSYRHRQRSAIAERGQITPLPSRRLVRPPGRGRHRGGRVVGPGELQRRYAALICFSGEYLTAAASWPCRAQSPTDERPGAASTLAPATASDAIGRNRIATLRTPVETRSASNVVDSPALSPGRRCCWPPCLSAYWAVRTARG